jgi:hypothetical protein
MCGLRWAAVWEAMMAMIQRRDLQPVYHKNALNKRWINGITYAGETQSCYTGVRFDGLLIHNTKGAGND